jgi:hypothetical protein
MILFGAGTAFIKPVAGNMGPNPTPGTLGVMQSCDIEFSGSSKTLYGQQQSPVAVARSEMKYTAKAKFAQIFGKQWCDYFFGQATSASYKSASLNESHTVPASPYTVTISPPNSGTFSEDLGVSYASSGLSLVRVTATPATGQYSVNEATGVYTFAAGDTTANVFVSYLYSLTTGGVSMVAANELMGFAPTLELTWVGSYNNQGAVVKLYNCLCSKLTLQAKNTDFSVPDIEFEAFANSAGNVLEYNFTQ